MQSGTLGQGLEKDGREETQTQQGWSIWWWKDGGLLFSHYGMMRNKSKDRNICSDVLGGNTVKNVKDAYSGRSPRCPEGCAAPGSAPTGQVGTLQPGAAAR